MASGPENGISLSRDPGVSEGSSLDPSSLHVGTDCPEAHEPTAELGGGSDDDAFVPPLPPGDGPGQAIILHGATAPQDESESSYYSTSSDEEEDESQLPPGPIEPARCTATGPGFTGGAAGRPVKMVITAKDAKGRRIREGGASVVVTLEAAHKSTILVTAQVQDHVDGTYTATYECPGKGPYQVRVVVVGACLLVVWLFCSDCTPPPPVFLAALGNCEWGAHGPFSFSDILLSTHTRCSNECSSGRRSRF